MYLNPQWLLTKMGGYRQAAAPPGTAPAPAAATPAAKPVVAVDPKAVAMHSVLSWLFASDVGDEFT